MLQRRWKSSSTVVKKGKIARSIKDVARGGIFNSLLLADSEDLICKNLMCEHVGSSCTCKLAVVLERLPLLERLDLSNNHLRQLPKRLFETISITDLNLSNNLLQEISDDISSLKNLETLDLRRNQLIQLPEKALLSLKKLKSIRVGGNPLENHHVQLKELCEKLDFDEETSIQRE